MLKDLTKRLYYFSTFDGYLEKRFTNARLRIVMIEDSLDYLQYVGETLTEMSIGYTIKPKSNNHGFKNSKPQLVLATESHPVLTKIYNRIYIDKHKVIDPHMLTMMDFEAMAIMFMCDGSSSWTASGGAQVYIHTNGFSYAENESVKKVIKDKLNLEFNVVKNKTWWELRLRNNDSDAFMKGIQPYITKCFRYKVKIKAND